VTAVSDINILAEALTDATAAGITVCVGAALLDCEAEVRASWDEGVEWLAARRRDLTVVVEVSGAGLLAALVWLLSQVLPAHGHHRTGAAR
jgi:hypothetical protein